MKAKPLWIMQSSTVMKTFWLIYESMQRKLQIVIPKSNKADSKVPEHMGKLPVISTVVVLLLFGVVITVCNFMPDFRCAYLL
jgi:hypothetical protein